MRDRSRWNIQYMQRILSCDPIAYWMQNERVGTVSYDRVSSRSNGARNGAYTGVTLGQPGIGDGETSPSFDGANGFNDIYTASLNSVFNGSQGTVFMQARVANAGVWTDGAFRVFMHLFVDANNYVRIVKINTNNTIRFRYTAGGTVETVDHVTSTPLWFSLAQTWDKASDEVRAYFNGAQTGATQSGLGVWAGNLSAAACTIGALDTTPTQPFLGRLAHGCVFDYVLSPNQIDSLDKAGAVWRDKA